MNLNNFTNNFKSKKAKSENHNGSLEVSKKNISRGGKVPDVQKKIPCTSYRFTSYQESIWLRLKVKAKETPKDSASNKWGNRWSRIRIIYKIVLKNNIKVLLSNKIVQENER